MTSDRDYTKLGGKEHFFPDGISLKIVQVKHREAGIWWVTYEHVIPGAFPRRFSMKASEFMDTYGHLFQID